MRLVSVTDSVGTAVIIDFNFSCCLQSAGYENIVEIESADNDGNVGSNHGNDGQISGENLARDPRRNQGKTQGQFS